MNKYIKKTIITASTIIAIIVAIISTFFIVKYINNRKKIDNVLEIYSNATIQETINEETKDYNLKDNMLKIDDENVVGVIKIDKISYEGLIYDGTSLNTLAKGIGHFECSSYFNGNVCLAGHNYNNVWGKLYTLKPGDTIIYTSFLGTKQYKVSTITEIEETNLNVLEETEENKITLITCVYNKPTKRLCVQALEAK